MVNPERRHFLDLTDEERASIQHLLPDSVPPAVVQRVVGDLLRALAEGDRIKAQEDAIREREEVENGA